MVLSAQLMVYISRDVTMFEDLCLYLHGYNPMIT
jgi:hypothetical protein